MSSLSPPRTFGAYADSAKPGQRERWHRAVSWLFLCCDRLTITAASWSHETVSVAPARQTTVGNLLAWITILCPEPTYRCTPKCHARLAGERIRLAAGTDDNRRSSTIHHPEHTCSDAPGQKENGWHSTDSQLSLWCDGLTIITEAPKPRNNAHLSAAPVLAGQRRHPTRRQRITAYNTVQNAKHVQ